MVQDLALRPSTMTVQAPQLEVSQPMWVPVSPSPSRRKWTSRVRASTSASCAAPLTVTLMWCVLMTPSSGVRRRALVRETEGAQGHLPDHRALVVGRAVSIAHRLGLGGCGIGRRGEGFLARGCAHEDGLGIGGGRRRRHGGEADAGIGDRAAVQAKAYRDTDRAEVTGPALELLIGAAGSRSACRRSVPRSAFRWARWRSRRPR